MSAATLKAIPFTAPRPASQPWSPTDRDRLIFQWVKFDGHKQSWVASQLGIHQITVSRIVDRYERWIAHGGPSQQGGLSRDERLRAQRWLTYERNEWILNSALRIAGEMEHPTDVSQSTITRSPQDYTKETEVRTQHATLHRSGLAARFLRLAHRINMDQQKLVERDPLPDLEPLSIDDHFPALADTPAEEPVHSSPHAPREESVPVRAQIEAPTTVSTDSPTADAPSPMHKTHTAALAEQPLTNCRINDYDQNQPAKKTSTPAYPVAASPPEGTDSNGSITFAPPSEQPHPASSAYY